MMDKQERDEMAARLQAENQQTLADQAARREARYLSEDFIAAPAAIVTKAVRTVAQLEDDHRADVALRQRDVNEIITARLASFLDTLADLTGEHTSEILEPVLVRLVAAETEIIRLRGLLGGGSTRAIGLVTRHVA